MDSKDIAAGQVWTYKYRTGEEKSRVRVFKVDNVSENLIVHIRIDNLKLTDRNTGEMIGEYIEHLPMDLKVFTESICELESFVETPVTEGYWIWKEQFDAEKAGVWAIGISNVITLIEDTLTKD